MAQGVEILGVARHVGGGLVDPDARGFGCGADRLGLLADDLA